MKAKANPAKVDAKTLQTYAGVYGERKVTLENGALYYQRIGPKYRLIPMTATVFLLDGLEYFRVEFEVKDGRIVGAHRALRQRGARAFAADEIMALLTSRRGAPIIAA